jgi:hypothetical protein
LGSIIFLYAYAEMDLGALVHVWPRNPSEEEIILKMGQ